MPIVKTGSKSIYYAHVPKCGGSAVQDYLTNRFGPLAFEDRRHTTHEPKALWSRTSPQHIDKQSLSRLFPPGFFDAQFTIVRHPVARIVSAYHFQLEVEEKISKQTNFHEWLLELEEGLAEDPFRFDNHVRPMSDIVPEDTRVFHLEHGLDALVPFFDDIVGSKSPPRSVGHTNKRGDFAKTSGEKVVPSGEDIKVISSIYGEDFERFGYLIGEKMPLAQKPYLSPSYLKERDADRERASSGLQRVRSALRRFT